MLTLTERETDRLSAGLQTEPDFTYRIATDNQKVDWKTIDKTERLKEL